MELCGLMGAGSEEGSVSSNGSSFASSGLTMEEQMQLHSQKHLNTNIGSASSSPSGGLLKSKKTLDSISGHFAGRIGKGSGKKPISPSGARKIGGHANKDAGDTGRSAQGINMAYRSPFSKWRQTILGLGCVFHPVPYDAG